MAQHRLPAGRADAEAAYGLTRGTIRRELGDEAAAGQGTDAAMVQRIVARDEGVIYRVVESQADRQLNASHQHAIGQALARRSEALLRPFRGHQVASVELETRLDVLTAMFELGTLAGGPYPELRGAVGVAA
jgi:hypothetical protein